MRWLTISVNAHVHGPVEEAFAYASNVENMDRWMAGVSDARWTSGSDRGQGASFASKYTYFGRTSDITYEVTETETDPDTKKVTERQIEKVERFVPGYLEGTYQNFKDAGERVAGEEDFEEIE